MTDILNAAIALACLVFGVWAIRRGVHRARRAVDYRTRNDRRAAWLPLYTDPPVIETAPGNNSDLLLDAALTYYGPAGLQRLHNAINETREGDSL